MTPPIVIAMSATLKIGHHWKSMKSTTPPRSQPGVAEQAVDDVADRAADDQADGDRVTGLARAPDRHEQHDDDDERDDADDRARALALAERHAGVERQVEPQRPDDVDVAVVERASSAHHLVSWSTSTTAAAITQRRRGASGPTLSGGRSVIGASSAADPADLLLDEHRRPRDRLEPLPRDRTAGHDE